MRKKTYVFGCPVCQKQFRTDEPGEPLCTGPNETLDEHELTVMHLKRIDWRDVHPAFAAKRSEGQLIMPNMQEEIEREVKLILPS